jgi:succinate dehydrogenase / fumarate reductase membrane anchor subunit
MVTPVTSLGRNGLYDWLVQRVSAVVLLVYFLFLAFFIGTADGLTYEEWQALFSQTWMRVFSLGALVSLCAHAWIGMWTIATDYLTRMTLGSAATLVRLLFQLLCLGVLMVYFVWCVQILWSL